MMYCGHNLVLGASCGNTVSVPNRSKSVLFINITRMKALAVASVKHRFFPQFDSCSNFILVSERINWENTQNYGEYARSDCAVNTLKRVNYFRNCKMQKESRKKRLIRRSICSDCTHLQCYSSSCANSYNWRKWRLIVECNFNKFVKTQFAGKKAKG